MIGSIKKGRMRLIIHLLKIAVFLLIPLLYSGSTYASHSMGADMTYECLGGNTYRITLAFYRDCIGSPAPSNPYVTINSSSCSQSLGVTLTKLPGTGQEVTPACSSAVTTCGGGSFTGIQEWIYTGVVTLPAQCSDWIFGYSLCCRNAAITTINSPGSNTFYISSTLNNLVTPCNSSPTFSNKPVPFLCIGQQFCFNHGAYDADGDSLVYQLISPRQTATTSVSYVGGYSASNPLNSVPATSFNSTTGDICLTPQNIEVTVTAVLVKEYRNGVLIGSVERDLQLTVMNCSNNIPSVTGIDGTSNFSLSACVNQPICFDIFSNDPDAGQQLTVSWNGGIPAATFNSTGGLHPSSRFCWTPTAADAGRMHSFTVSVHDDACPYFGSQTFSYNITVSGLVVIAGPDQTVPCSGLATLNTSISGASGPITYQWNNGATTAAINVSDGTYWVTATDGSCISSDTAVVIAPTPPVASFSVPSVLCANVPVSFTDHSTASTGTISSRGWWFGDGGISTSTNPQHLYSSAGTYNVRLIVTNSAGCTDTVNQTVVVSPTTNSAFTWNSVCVNSPISFTDQTTGSPVSWSWNFGDGGTSTSQNPAHTFTTAGIYQVRLITANSNGCLDTVINNVNVVPPPSANAGSDRYTCLGGTVSLVASGGQSYVWSPGGQTTATISVSPSATTTYTVTVTNSSGCSSTDNVVVSINPLPVVSAGVNTTICQGGTTTLTASGANLYSWSPGGQTTPSINVNPATTTNYTVTGTNANGCSNTDVVVVNVNSLPATTAGTDVNICVGSTATLNASGAVSYVWSPGGSTNSSITVSPASTSTYTVTGTNAAGCTASDIMQVTVNPNPAVSLSDKFICQGNTATFDAGNPGSTYNWSNGSTARTITVSSQGTYSVVVTSPSGCQSTASAVLTVGSLPSVSVQNFLICDGQPAVLNTNHPGCAFLWSNGATSASITAWTAGTYNVTITDANGCSSTMPNIVKVNPRPVPNFTPSNACSGSPIIFTDLSTVNGSSIQSVEWKFGDGTTDNTSVVTHSYASTGSYQITLIATTANGCVDSVTKTINIHPVPAVTIAAATTCQNVSAQFTSNTTIASGLVNGFNWSFGDGSSSYQPSPSHLYNSAGVKNVTLVVTSDHGCRDTANTTVTILEIPAASFTTMNGCEGSVISLANNSTSTGAAITGYSWNFGNGTTSAVASPSYSYASSGIFNVTLSVTDANGCIGTMNAPVTIHPLPIANFNFPTICDGSPASFGNYSSVNSGIIQSYQWDFGDNGTSALSNPTHTYTTTGSYSVSLIATTSLGCSDTITKPVTVNPSPVPAFTTADICEGGTNYFADYSSIAAGSITGRSWDFGDGGTSSNISPYHFFSAPGAYGVTLTLTSNWGCVSSLTNVTNIFPNPSASFITATACEGSSTQFLNLSDISDGTQISSDWSFGDFQSSQDDNPLHAYSTYGLYTVNLEVTSIHGCTNHYTDTTRVYRKPIARFSAPDVCDAAPLTFVNQSTSSDGHIVSSMWTFGDGNSSSENQPTHTYHDTGHFNVQLITLSSLGCLGNFADSVAVFPHPTVSVNINNACAGMPVTMTASSNMGNGMTYSWSNGSAILSNSPSYNHIFNQPGTYNIVLTATSPQGCDGLASAQVSVYPKPNVAFASTTVCQNSPTQFVNQTTVPTGSISVYTWNFGDSNSSSQANPNHTYVSAGTFNTVLTAITNNGCSASSVQSVTVNPKPTVSFNASGQGCGPLLVGFNQTVSISSGNVSGYLWNFGDGEVSNDPGGFHTYTSPGTYNVSLHAVSDQGCTASFTQTNAIRVYPDPIADFSISQTEVDIEMPIVQFTNQSMGYQFYQWNFGDGTGSTDLNPSHAFADTGTYSAMLITVNNYGCRDTMFRLIDVKLHSTLFVANSFTPNDDGRNDDFRPYHTNMKDISVWIFDRWGKMLTSWEGLDGSWDGIYQGRKCPADTYVYKIVGTGVDGKNSEWVGHVSIVY